MLKVSSQERQGLIIKIAIAWLCIFLLAGFLIATRSAYNPLTMSVIPEVPRAGEPVVVTFNLNNPSDVPSTTSYRLYVNGELAEDGSITIAPKSGVKYQYACAYALERGEQINFALRASSDGGSFDKVISLPAYPPQLMSSFVSFAAFSASVMSSMISMEYFSDAFGSTGGMNVGMVVAIVLIALLIFLELTQEMVNSRKFTVLSSYRASFGHMSTILFIVFIGMVFTQVWVMVVAT